MTVSAMNRFWDEQAPDYPAPLCEICNIPKWVNKRYLRSMQPVVVVRLGYECRLCSEREHLAQQQAAVEA